MIEQSEAIKGNIEWLKTVCAEGSGYSIRFKYFAQKNIEKFEHKINGTIQPKELR